MRLAVLPITVNNKKHTNIADNQGVGGRKMFDFIFSAVVILFLYVVGEIVSNKTKAFVPSVFVVAVLFLIGYWSGVIPTDIIERSGFSAIGISAMLIIVVHMGTMLSPQELIMNWKTVVISLVSIAGLTILLLTLGGQLMDWNTVIVAIPPLAGGMTAAIIMQNGAAESGYDTLAVLAIVVYVIQGFVGYPLTAIFLKREARRQMAEFPEKREKWLIAKGNSTPRENVQRRRLIPPVPEQYRSIYLSLLMIFATVFIAIQLEKLTAGTVSRYVFCLLLGVIFAETGILEKKCLDATQSYGIFVTAAMAMVFAGLSAATPEMFKIIIIPLTKIIVIGVTGLLLFSGIVGKFLGYSLAMSFAISLNALYGFPPNMIITNESINSVTENSEEKEYLSDHIMPKMLIGGFTSVTVTSTLLAGIFINFLR